MSGTAEASQSQRDALILAGGHCPEMLAEHCEFIWTVCTGPDHWSLLSFEERIDGVYSREQLQQIRSIGRQHSHTVLAPAAPGYSQQSKYLELWATICDLIADLSALEGGGGTPNYSFLPRDPAQPRHSKIRDVVNFLASDVRDYGNLPQECLITSTAIGSCKPFWYRMAEAQFCGLPDRHALHGVLGEQSRQTLQCAWDELTAVLGPQRALRLDQYSATHGKTIQAHEWLSICSVTPANWEILEQQQVKPQRRRPSQKLADNLCNDMAWVRMAYSGAKRPIHLRNLQYKGMACFSVPESELAREAIHGSFPDQTVHTFSWQRDKLRGVTRQGCDARPKVYLDSYVRHADAAQCPIGALADHVALHDLVSAVPVLQAVKSVAGLEAWAEQPLFQTRRDVYSPPGAMNQQAENKQFSGLLRVAGVQDTSGHKLRRLRLAGGNNILIATGSDELCRRVMQHTAGGAHNNDYMGQLPLLTKRLLEIAGHRMKGEVEVSLARCGVRPSVSFPDLFAAACPLTLQHIRHADELLLLANHPQRCSVVAALRYFRELADVRLQDLLYNLVSSRRAWYTSTPQSSHMLKGLTMRAVSPFLDAGTPLNQQLMAFFNAQLLEQQKLDAVARDSLIMRGMPFQIQTAQTQLIGELQREIASLREAAQRPPPLTQRDMLAAFTADPWLLTPRLAAPHTVDGVWNKFVNAPYDGQMPSLRACLLQTRSDEWVKDLGRLHPKWYAEYRWRARLCYKIVEQVGADKTSADAEQAAVSRLSAQYDSFRAARKKTALVKFVESKHFCKVPPLWWQ